MENLMDFYRTSIVLCTATQPALDSIFDQHRRYIELCPNINEQFKFFKRVIYENLGIIEFDTLIERLKTEKEHCVLLIQKNVHSSFTNS